MASVEQTEAETMRLFHKWVNRHLVVLVVTYSHLDDSGRVKGEQRVAACSGSILSMGDWWFFVTAGHVLIELDDLYCHRNVRIDGACFIDSFGLQAKYESNIPFDYASCTRHACHEGGLDYGIIVLSPNYRRLMLANSVEAIPINNWISQDIEKCTSFALLGIPFETVSIETRHAPGVNMGAAWISLKRLTELPEGAEVTEHERFIGDLGKPHDRRLEGTSGGPIIGFADKDGEVIYWIVALQSTSLENRYVFGCPTKIVGEIILENFREVLNELPK